MRRRGLAQGTIDHRRQRLRRFDSHVGLVPTTAQAIERWLDTLHLGAKARYQWVSDLHCFYRWAMDWGHLSEDPTVQVTRPKQRRYLPRPIDSGDLALALQMSEPTMHAWLTLASFAGLRCMEIANLHPDCLMWESNLLRVVGKGSKERAVPIHPKVESTLRSMRLPSRGPIFRRPSGGPYRPEHVSRQASEFFDDLGIDATLHMCRHWFGTKLYQACRDLRVVQETMGHSDPSTTASYVQWSKQEAHRAVAALSLEDGDVTLFSEWAS